MVRAGGGGNQSSRERPGRGIGRRSRGRPPKRAGGGDDRGSSSKRGRYQDENADRQESESSSSERWV